MPTRAGSPVDGAPTPHSVAPAPAPGGARRLSRWPAVLIGAVALGACSLAVVIGGAALPLVTGLDDVGAPVRWGLPLLRVVHDLAASLTIGLLVVGALLLPGRTPPAAMLRAGRTAVGSGVVWVVSGMLGVFLGFADAAGTPLDGPDYWSQFHTFIWTLETLRVGIISAVLAAVATGIAALALSRRGLAAAAFVAVAAILPLALAGHASGDADHETAVNTLAAHLVGATLWVGGLLALLVLRPVLGRRLPVVVARYSSLALWCFVAVGISGVVSALIRLGGVGNLLTAYGSLVLVKTGCLVVLGGIGVMQRRRVVGQLSSSPASGPLFMRFALTEGIVMAVAFGFATALARSESPAQVNVAPSTIAEGLTGFPEPRPPTAASLLTLWRWDWLWSVVPFVAVALYLVWVNRLHRRGDSWPVTRGLAWVCGWAVFFWATCGAPGVLGRVSFSWHMIEHMVIAMGAPVLLVLAAPVTLALRALPARKDGSLGPRELLLGMTHSRLLRVAGNPVVAAALFFLSLAVFYYSPLFELALETHTGHVLMVAHFLLTGYLFAWALVGVDPGPPKWAPPLRLLILLVTISFHAFFGVALMTATSVLAPGFFGRLGLPWVPDPVVDQQRGGGIAWAFGEAPTLLLAVLVVLAWVRSDAVETRRADRHADRDGGTELAAYNAQLEAMRARSVTRAETSDESSDPRRHT